MERPERTWKKALDEGSIVILEKDVQGARALRRVYPEGIFSYLSFPSIQDEPKKRIESRGTENESKKTLRIGKPTTGNCRSQ